MPGLSGCRPDCKTSASVSTSASTTRQNVAFGVYQAVYRRLLTTSFDAYRLAYRSLRTSGSMPCSSCASCRPPAHDGGQVVPVPVQALRALTRADSCLPGGLGWGRESKTARACTRWLSSRMGCSFCAPRQGRRVRDGWESEIDFTLLSVGACTRWLGWRSNIGEIFRWSRACVMSSRWTPSTGSWACTRWLYKTFVMPWAMGSGISSPKNLGKQRGRGRAELRGYPHLK